MIRAKVLPKFPSRVEGDNGVTVTKTNGVWTIGYDLDSVASVGTGSLVREEGATLSNVTLNGALELNDPDVTDGTFVNPFIDAGTLQNRLVKGIYIIAASAVAVPHTGDTNETTLATITVPANSLGANGILRISVQWGAVGTADTKTFRVKFNGTTYLQNTSLNTTLSARTLVTIANRNATNSQVGNPADAVNWSISTSAVVTSTHDTTTALDITLTGQLANGADTVSVQSYIVELIVP